ncbi:MAG: hypothetical protein AAGG08_20285, partial [Actinomycetota bacterium]
MLQATGVELPDEETERADPDEADGRYRIAQDELRRHTSGGGHAGLRRALIHYGFVRNLRGLRPVCLVSAAVAVIGGIWVMVDDSERWFSGLAVIAVAIACTAIVWWLIDDDAVRSGGESYARALFDAGEALQNLAHVTSRDVVPLLRSCLSRCSPEPLRLFSMKPFVVFGQRVLRAEVAPAVEDPVRLRVGAQTEMTRPGLDAELVVVLVDLALVAHSTKYRQPEILHRHALVRLRRHVRRPQRNVPPQPLALVRDLRESRQLRRRQQRLLLLLFRDARLHLDRHFFSRSSLVLRAPSQGLGRQRRRGHRVLVVVFARLRLGRQRNDSWSLRLSLATVVALRGLRTERLG